MDETGEPTYAPLLPGGFYDVACFADIDKVCVAPFARSRTRIYLFQRFQLFCNYLFGFNIPFEMWIDGSFLTTKEEPNDIDVVVQVEICRLEQLSAVRQNMWKTLFADRAATRARWQVDAYMFFRGKQSRAVYWANWYGHTRSGEEKGILRMVVQP